MIAALARNHTVTCNTNQCKETFMTTTKQQGECEVDRVAE